MEQGFRDHCGVLAAAGAAAAPLTAAQVGLGLTVAGVAAFLAAVPMRKLVDLFGPKTMWAVSAFGQASMFAVWPLVTGFTGYVGMAVGMEVIGGLSAGRRAPSAGSPSRWSGW